MIKKFNEIHKDPMDIWNSPDEALAFAKTAITTTIEMIDSDRVDYTEYEWDKTILNITSEIIEDDKGIVLEDSNIERDKQDAITDIYYQFRVKSPIYKQISYLKIRKYIQFYTDDPMWSIAIAFKNFSAASAGVKYDYDHKETGSIIFMGNLKVDGSPSKSKNLVRKYSSDLCENKKIYKNHRLHESTEDVSQEASSITNSYKSRLSAIKISLEDILKDINTSMGQLCDYTSKILDNSSKIKDINDKYSYISTQAANAVSNTHSGINLEDNYSVSSVKNDSKDLMQLLDETDKLEACAYEVLDLVNSLVVELDDDTTKIGEYLNYASNIRRI